jgi:hypothetical protein
MQLPGADAGGLVRRPESATCVGAAFTTTSGVLRTLGCRTQRSHLSFPVIPTRSMTPDNRRTNKHGMDTSSGPRAKGSVEGRVSMGSIRAPRSGIWSRAESLERPSQRKGERLEMAESISSLDVLQSCRWTLQ